MDRFIEFIVLMAIALLLAIGKLAIGAPPQTFEVSPAFVVQRATETPIKDCKECSNKTTCPCSNLCTCGCNEGLPCECCDVKPIIYSAPDVKLWREPVTVRSSIRASSPAIVTRPVDIPHTANAAILAAPQAWAMRPTMYAAPLRGSNAQSCGPRG